MAAVRVSTRGDYACRALLSLALHEDERGPTSVRDIAERTGLPQPYLEQILLALKGAGLVRSKRGVGGGYVLARPPDEIRLAEIVSAVDGPITLGDFGEPHQDGACDHEGQCVLLAVWDEVGEHMRTTSTATPLPTSPPWPAANGRGRNRRSATTSDVSHESVQSGEPPAMSGGGSAANDTASPVRGCAKASSAACSNGRARSMAAAPAAVPASPTTGWSMAARWTRIWCVRPVSSRHASRARRPAACRSSRPRSECGPSVPVVRHRHARRVTRRASDRASISPRGASR